MANSKKKVVDVPDIGVVSFPDSMEDSHISNVIKLFRAQKKTKSLTTEKSEHERQLKPSQPLSTAIPTMPEWAKTPLPDLAEKGNKAFNRSLGLPEVSPMEQQIREAGKQFDTQHPIAGGVMQGVSNFGKGMLTPANIGLMLTAPQSKLLSAYFATQAMKGSYASAKEAEKAFHGGRNYDAARYATESLLGLGVAGMAGKHAVEGTAVDTSTLKEPTGPKTIEGEGKATSYVPPYLRPASEIVPVEATANISRRGVPAAPKPVAKPLSMEQVKAQAEALKAQKPAVVPQNLTYYRGTDPGNTERITTGDHVWDSYLFVADQPKHAQNYGRTIEQIQLKPDAKVLRENTRDFKKVVGPWRKGENMLQFSSRAAQTAQKAGYDAVHFQMQGTVGTAILNRNAIQSRGPFTPPQATPVVPVVAPNATPAAPVQKQPVPIVPTQAVPVAPKTPAVTPIAPQGTMPLSDIVASPDYQFNPKANKQTGIVEPLQGQFDADKAGKITVWKNPADGKNYLVHGFHRYDLAKRSGVQNVAVEPLPNSELPDLQGRLKVREMEKEDAAKKGVVPVEPTANLTKQTETPEFKNWFGDWQDPHAWSSKRDPNKPDVSMAVKNGKPMVLYHATAGDFDQFEVGRKSYNSNVFGPYETNRHGIFLAEDPSFAGEFVIDPESPNSKPKKGGKTLPVYVNIKSPLDLREGKSTLDQETLDEFKEHGVNPRWILNGTQHTWELFDDEDGKEFVRAAQEIGYDGAIITDDSQGDAKNTDTWVAFKPEQIKSAIGNKGTFNPLSGDITANLTRKATPTPTSAYKAADQSQPFYLKSESIVSDKMRGPMPADDLHKMLLSNGVKPEEMKWTGLDELLQGKGKEKVTPQEIQEHLAGNNLQIQEVTKGRTDNRAAIEDLDKKIEEINHKFSVSNKAERDALFSEREALSEQRRNLVNTDYKGQDTKFGSYVLPGGEPGSYRELLVTMPSRSTPMEYPEPLTALPDGYEVTRDSQRVGDQYAIIPPGQVHGRPFDNRYYATPEKAQDAALQLLNQRRNTAAADEWRSKNEGNSFRSNHWDEPNPASHVRFDDRKGQNGEKILFIEEAQDDWAQKIRKEGVREDPKEVAKQPMKATRYNGYWEIHLDDGRFVTNVQDWQHPEVKTDEQAIAEARRRIVENPEKTRIAKEGQPDRPFKKTDEWTSLVMKRMLKYAVDHGYDAVAWAPGDVHFGRWGSQRFDWKKNGDHWEVAGTEQHGGNAGGVNIEEEAERQGYLQKGAAKVKTEADLRKIVKQVMSRESNDAQIDTQTKKIWSRMQNEDSGTSMPRKEGFEAYYDQIVPQAANKLGKQWGAKVGETEINTGRPTSGEGWEQTKMWDQLRSDGRRGQMPLYAIFDRGGNWVGTTGDPSSVDDSGGEETTVKVIDEKGNLLKDAKLPSTQKSVPYLSITPEMRASGPMPLFNLVYKSESAPKEELDKVWSELESLKDKREDARQAGDEDKEAVYDRKAKDLAKQWMDLAHKDIGQIRDLYDGSRVLYLTRSGLRGLTQAVYGKGIGYLQLNGVSMTSAQVDQVIHNLSILKPTAAGELKTLLEKAKDKNGNVAVSAIPYKGESVNEALSRLREELNHGWQKVFGDAVGNHLAPEQFDELNLAIPQGMKDHLAQNYPGLANSESPKISRMRVLEASAHMLSGSPSELGMTEEDVAPYLFQYFQAVEKQHGEKALDELVHITTKARQIKEDYFNATGRDKGSKSGQGNVPSVQEQGAGGDQGSSAEAGRGVPPRSDGEGGTEGLNNAKGSGVQDSRAGNQGDSGSVQEGGPEGAGGTGPQEGRGSSQVPSSGDGKNTQRTGAGEIDATNTRGQSGGNDRGLPEGRERGDQEDRSEAQSGVRGEKGKGVNEKYTQGEASKSTHTPPTLAQVKEWAAMLNTNNVRVKTPDGMVHIFPDEKSAAAFRSAAGLE